MFSNNNFQDDKTKESKTKKCNCTSYFNLSSAFDPNHGLSYITYLLSSFHLKNPSTMTDDNDKMDMSDDTIDNNSKSNCSIIDNKSGLLENHGNIIEANEKKLRNLFFAISLYLSKAWQCNVLVNDTKTRHFFYSGKPLITYAFIIQYQFRCLLKINDSNEILLWRQSLLFDTGMNRIAREKKRHLDSAKSFEFNEILKSYKKKRGSKMSLDKSNNSRNKMSYSKLPVFNDDYMMTLKKSSMSSETCASNVSIFDMSSSSSCIYNDSDDLYMMPSDKDKRSKGLCFDDVDEKKDKFSIGTVFNKLKTKKHKISSKIKTCVSNVKGRVTGIRRRKNLD